MTSLFGKGRAGAGRLAAVAVLAAGLLTTGMSGPAGATAAAAPDGPAAAPQLPSAAIAMGDSFISGEGAGQYKTVIDENGQPQGFPGWTADNSHPYFCHRSRNASIEVAALSGIDARFNLACSGGQPHDMAAPSSQRPDGRGVAAQIAQLREVATTHNIDVVLIGLGSNNSQFTFGNVAADCAGRFVADGYTGWWEVWIHFINWVSGAEVSERPCRAGDLATPAQVDAARAETTAALRLILDVLDEVDADGVHRIVLQDYTNPLPFDYAQEYHQENRRSDTRDKFRPLVDERYAAGCPAHRASLGPAHEFSQALGTVVSGAHATLSAERPDVDLVYLNVQHAFDGARLCENPGSPYGTLATPLRLMDQPNGQFVTDFGPFNKLDIKRLTKTCERYFQTCQESWHPNASGHRVLGQCLTLAVGTAADAVTCQRQPDGTITG